MSAGSSRRSATWAPGKCSSCDRRRTCRVGDWTASSRVPRTTRRLPNSGCASGSTAVPCGTHGSVRESRSAVRSSRRDPSFSKSRRKSARSPSRASHGGCARRRRKPVRRPRPFECVVTGLFDCVRGGDRAARAVGPFGHPTRDSGSSEGEPSCASSPVPRSASSPSRPSRSPPATTAAVRSARRARSPARPARSRARRAAPRRRPRRCRCRRRTPSPPPSRSRRPSRPSSRGPLRRAPPAAGSPAPTRDGIVARPGLSFARAGAVSFHDGPFRGARVRRSAEGAHARRRGRVALVRWRA